MRSPEGAPRCGGVVDVPAGYARRDDVAPSWSGDGRRPAPRMSVRLPDAPDAGKWARSGCSSGGRQWPAPTTGDPPGSSGSVDSTEPKMTESSRGVESTPPTMTESASTGGTGPRAGSQLRDAVVGHGSDAGHTLALSELSRPGRVSGLADSTAEPRVMTARAVGDTADPFHRLPSLNHRSSLTHHHPHTLPSSLPTKPPPPPTVTPPTSSTPLTLPSFTSLTPQAVVVLVGIVGSGVTACRAPCPVRGGVGRAASRLAGGGPR